MGRRFGNPTENFGSGTEEEFANALKKKEEQEKLGRSIEVTFLIKEDDVPFDKLTDDQIQQAIKVRSFKAKYSNDGLYKTFNSTDKLTNEVKLILRQYHKAQSDSKVESEYQNEMLAEIPSKDVFQIQSTFFSGYLNSLGAEFTNNYIPRLTLRDIYVPLDLDIVNSGVDDQEDIGEYETISSSVIDCYQTAAPTKIIITGDDHSGKTTFCKNIYLNFHKKGIIPIYVSGNQIKSSQPDKLEKLLERSFAEQYSPLSLARFQRLESHRKMVIIDDFDEITLTDKHKFKALQSLENLCEHVVVTSNSMFLFNASLSAPEEFKSFAHFKTYRMRDMGHLVREELIKNWLRAGRDEQLEDEELFSLVEKSTHLVNSVIGTNFVPKKPFIVLVVLQAIQTGSSNDLTSSSFVRYYEYLINTTLLSNAQNETDIYYQFLPVVACYMQEATDKRLSEGKLNEIIDNFCITKDVKRELLIDIKSGLVAAELLVHSNGSFSFKHSYTYYYFLARYFSDHIGETEVRSKIEKICRAINIKE